MPNASANALTRGANIDTDAKTILLAISGAFSLIGSYRRLIKEIDRLLYAPDRELFRLGISRDQVVHHVARKHQLID